MNGFASPVRRRRVLQLTASLPLLAADDGWAATGGTSGAAAADDSPVCASPKITKITGSIR